ncbi:BrnA antitoxin family protein [Xenorhabdus sp. PR6a]|uniref:BrnA antitoxin family protein n=1 Tax=Xenorhabdus sp. PR6a TaxID=3025877 RepID=UPI002358756F|nr:BrnA antitoxin family protein [Xenorhabdus sp. PR6a]MDC9582902.1 BrnA antitoxin family protein [Xenorhabdus sp. PR6a]
MSMVRYKRNELPPLSEKREGELRELSDKPDSDIDYSDIEPLDNAFWKNATQGQFYRPVKKQTSIRIDADVLAWLKDTGKGYQTRLNAILREAMMRDLHRK